MREKIFESFIKMALGKLNFYIYHTPFGCLTIGADEVGICDVLFGDVQLSGTYVSTHFTNDASTQIMQYFAKKRTSFDVPLSLKGSPFQIQVWNALRKIPYGEVATPTQLGRMIGAEKSYKQIPKAAYTNRVKIIIPDHRLRPASKFEKPNCQSKVREALRKIEAL